MAVPFSNTHLRVPRGFGTILEGLTREVLRDQPEDIPKYATQYFEALLKERQGNYNFLTFNVMKYTLKLLVIKHFHQSFFTDVCKGRLSGCCFIFYTCGNSVGF
uniref:RIIa domain-containing protein n=1 Tax=Pundamilia nyererei TaxID=303518 RepID=A0A3B4GP96_9CICH